MNHARPIALSRRPIDALRVWPSRHTSMARQVFPSAPDATQSKGVRRPIEMSTPSSNHHLDVLHRGDVSGPARLPQVRQQFAQAAGRVRGQALQHIAQVRVRIDFVELGRRKRSLNRVLVPMRTH